MAQMFAALGKFGTNNKGSIQNFGIVGVTVGTEQLTKFIFFFCPCNYPMNKVYGSTFIWGPAAILLVVGYVMNRRTWRLTTGMCNRTQGVGRGCKRLIHFLFIFANISMKAILAPATWIVISFLKGDYYACAAWPGPNDKGVEEKFGLAPNTSIPPPCYFKSKPDPFDRSVTESIARDLRSYSHIIGWWFLSWAVLIGVFVMFVFRCLSKYSYEQAKYIEKYRNAEMKLFEDGLDAKAEAQAKIVVDQFFSKPRKKEEWDQIASINDKVMKSKRGKPIYSPMHKFVNKELVALELAQDDIVSDSAKKKHHLSSLVKKKRLNLKAKTPQAPTARPPAAASQSIPMVMMTGGPTRTVVQRPRQPVELHEGTHASMENQKQATSDDQAPPVPPKDTIPEEPQPPMESDPIEEANIADRNIMVPPVVDLEDDPIREANIAEQAEEIRRSMEDMAEDDLQITEDGGNHVNFQDEEEPLIT